MRARNRDACADCGASTYKLNEYYMVRHDVWERAWGRYKPGQPPPPPPVATACRLVTARDGRVYNVLFAAGARREILCIGCLERRINRTLMANDFTAPDPNEPRSHRSDMSERMRQRLSAVASMPLEPDKSGHTRNAHFPGHVLRGYQQRAATYLYERDAAFMIAPLGAGKGAAALTAFADLVRDGHRRHALVIAPKLVATTVWPTEIAAWPHLQHLRVAVLDGSPGRRKLLLAKAAERELTVIGVDLVPWLVRELAAVADEHPLFDVLIIDETSRLKDPSGKRARALLKVAGRFRTRWGLTGTPRPNSSQDLFMPAAIITNGALWGRAFVPWQQRHFRPRDPFGREWTALPGAEEQIAADFGSVAMTVADADMPDLPPLNVVVTSLKLPDTVMATYRAMQDELFATIGERGIEAVSPLVATGKCAQIANGFLYDEGNDDPVTVHEVKIDWLCELVESLDGEPLLIAYEFVEDLRTIRRALGDVPALGGETSASQAARHIAAWNEGKLPLLAFHPAAASHGLNLQFGGSRMAWLSPSWSAELTEQSIARIFRPGQTQHVTIHVCVAAGTVDEMKRNRVLGKMSAQEAFKRHLEQI
jgi:hypothetical protein